MIFTNKKTEHCLNWPNALEGRVQ